MLGALGQFPLGGFPPLPFIANRQGYSLYAMQEIRRMEVPFQDRTPQVITLRVTQEPRCIQLPREYRTIYVPLEPRKNNNEARPVLPNPDRE